MESPNQTSYISHLNLSLQPMNDTIPTPNYWWSIFTMKCPRCRRGPMFNDPNPYRKLKLSHIFDMPEKCPECGQRYDLEQGEGFRAGGHLPSLCGDGSGSEPRAIRHTAPGAPQVGARHVSGGGDRCLRPRLLGHRRHSSPVT